MALWQIIVLALVQGITEFLPISSSAHLILTPVLLGVPDQGQQFDIAVHVGTLVAVCLYFWRDVLQLPVGTLHLLGKRRQSPQAKLALHVLLGSIPVIIAGLVMHEIMPDGLRSELVIALTTIGFGLLLGVADWIGAKRKSLGGMDRLDALLIGASQILALIPGTSRSGITMTTARLAGYTREEAARFSLLLSIPAIAGAGTLGLIDAIQNGSLRLGLDLGLAALLSCLAALAAIAVMMRWLSKASFMPFVIYRLVLGIGLLMYIYV